MRRREFITVLGGAAAAWPLAAGAQETAMPVVAFVTPSERDSFPPRYVAAFRKGLSDTGYIEGQNVSVEYHWLEGRYDRLPALMADLVRRQVAVIATPGGSLAALAAKAATATIPIVFGVAENPVSTGLVANLARPGGNATGINFFLGEVVAKRLGLLHELVPKAVRLGVLVNPANGLTADAALRDIPEAARTLGLQVQVLKASTGPEIDAEKRPPWRPGPSQTRVLGRARGYPIRERSARRGVARRLLSCAVSSLRSATFACAPRATSWRQVMHRRPVDNVDSRVRSQTYGLKKNCTAFSAVRG